MLIPHSKPFIDDATIRRVSGQIESRALSNGMTAERFAAQLKHYTQTKSLYLTPSGLAAMVVALSALEIGAGDEVILPTYICVSVVEAIFHLGATPVFCDVGDEWVMTSETVAAVFTEKTRAIIVVHIFGIRADVPEFRRFNVPIIEDCCQCLATEINEKKIGADSDLAFYSFQATKCLTTGEGGAVACVNENFYEPLAKAAERFRYFFPFTDLQAALGLSQLEIYPAMLNRRSEIARFYFENLPDVLTENLRNAQATMYFRFPLLLKKDFETARREAESAGVAVRRGVDELLHQKYNSFSGNKKFPVAERLFASTVCIPIYPALTDAEMKKVAAVIKHINDED